MKHEPDIKKKHSKKKSPDLIDTKIHKKSMLSARIKI
jgi:hypothetical protein